MDDPKQTRREFLDTVEKLKKFAGSDWFMVRNYDEPPPVLATLLSAVCTLMLVRDSWKSARNLIGSSVQNMEVQCTPWENHERFTGSLYFDNLNLVPICKTHTI